MRLAYLDHAALFLYVSTASLGTYIFALGELLNVMSLLYSNVGGVVAKSVTD